MCFICRARRAEAIMAAMTEDVSAEDAALAGYRLFAEAHASIVEILEAIDKGWICPNPFAEIPASFLGGSETSAADTEDGKTRH